MNGLGSQDPNEIATLTQKEDGGATLTPKGGSAVGRLFVYWEALDGSDVSTMIEFEFTAQA